MYWYWIMDSCLDTGRGKSVTESIPVIYLRNVQVENVLSLFPHLRHFDLETAESLRIAVRNFPATFVVSIQVRKFNSQNGGLDFVNS